MMRRRFLLMTTSTLTLAVALTALGQQASVYDQSGYGAAEATAAQGQAAPAASYPDQSQQIAAVSPGVANYGQAAPYNPASRQAGVQPGATQAAGPPFPQDPVEQQFVYQALQMWERKSGEIKTFNTAFDRLEYTGVWDPGANKPLIQSTGSLSYSKPDRGSFKIDKISRWTKADPQNTSPDAPGEYALQKDEIGEQWVCDGKAVYEYNQRNKQLVVTPIPEEMRGQGIVDGPLPFLFGAEASKLMERYWIRSIAGNAEQIHLQAYPRRLADAANYESVEVMLDRKTMLPSALQVKMPNGQDKHVYMFRDPKVNGTIDKWFGDLFSAPRTPFGWTRVIAQQESAAAPGPQATNPDAPVQR